MSAIFMYSMSRIFLATLGRRTAVGLYGPLRERPGVDGPAGAVEKAQ